MAAYLYIFGMQGLFSMINNGAALYVLRFSAKDATIGVWEGVGAAIWLVGFLMEVVADAQLQKHRDDPAMQGINFDQGLFRYSRHPNYFGECLLWWGIYIIACGSGGYLTFYSCLFITLLIRYVSGVAMLERKQKKRATFRVYCQ